DRARVLLRLEQPRDEGDLVDPDLRCRALQPDVGSELGLDRVAKRVPPAFLARVPGQLDQACPLLRRHAVEVQHVADVAGRDGNPARLDPADLGRGALEVFGYFLTGEPGS